MRRALTFNLFGRQYFTAMPLKAVLARVALGLAVVQVVLALWVYRKLPLAGRPPRPVRLSHRVLGFGLFALTVPIAVHCLITYGVQLTSVRVAVHSLAGSFFYGAFLAKVLLVRTSWPGQLAHSVGWAADRKPGPGRPGCLTPVWWRRKQSKSRAGSAQSRLSRSPGDHPMGGCGDLRG